MKKSGFFENAKLIYGAFGITPLMYGSLGLEFLTGESLDSEARQSSFTEMMEIALQTAIRL